MIYVRIVEFLGRDLINWIMEHMSDIHSKKQAKAYASRLLAAGLIRHVVSKLTFTENCYYVFGDGILANDRNSTVTSGASGGTIKAEATTEVTYVGSPAPHGLGNRLATGRGIPHRLETTTLSPVAHDQTWLRRRRDCESPMTNDYASMVGESQIGSNPAGNYQMFGSKSNRQITASSQVTSSSLTNGKTYLSKLFLNLISHKLQEVVE